MGNILVILSAVFFFIGLFPVHIYNYVYVNTAEKYAAVNVSAYRWIRLVNLNTVKNAPNKMNVNGKDKQIDTSFIRSRALRIFNNLCLTKIVQVGDYGIQDEKSAYIALAQNSLTQGLYYFIKANGGRTKLKNYTVLNEEHGDVVYYAKVVGVINAVTVAKILTILIWGKLNEIVNKK